MAAKKMRYGFKTEANALAEEVRSDLGIDPLDALDPRILAAFLEIPIWALSEFTEANPAIGHLHDMEPNLFSAVTVFAGPRRTIVHNDAHAPGRQNSNLAHELSHGLLHHPPTPALDNKGCRDWNQAVEDEAEWLSGILLVSEAATIAIAKGKWTKAEAAEHFGVSQQMIQRRINATGAHRRVGRAQNWRR